MSTLSPSHLFIAKPFEVGYDLWCLEMLGTAGPRLRSGFLGQCFLIYGLLTLEGSKIASMEVIESTDGKQTNFRRA